MKKFKIPCQGEIFYRHLSYFPIFSDIFKIYIPPRGRNESIEPYEIEIERDLTSKLAFLQIFKNALTENF